VREHAARHLARYKVPATVEIVPELPRNEAGKLLRRELVPRDA
jgi:long-chain acyl-CoA synthetase